MVGKPCIGVVGAGHSALTCSLTQGCREPVDGSARGAVEGLGTLASEWPWSGYSTLTWFPAKGCRRPGVGAGSVRLWLPGNCCTGVVGAVYLVLTRSPAQGYRNPLVGAAQGREAVGRRASTSVCRKPLSGAGKRSINGVHLAYWWEVGGGSVVCNVVVFRVVGGVQRCRTPIECVASSPRGLILGGEGAGAWVWSWVWRRLTWVELVPELGLGMSDIGGYSGGADRRYCTRFFSCCKRPVGSTTPLWSFPHVGYR